MLFHIKLANSVIPIKKRDSYIDTMWLSKSLSKVYQFYLVNEVLGTEIVLLFFVVVLFASVVHISEYFLMLVKNWTYLPLFKKVLT